MPKILLEEMLSQVELNDLPAAWNTFDIKKFSRTKALWDYQQTAVENGIKTLWKYYEDFRDYQDNETLETTHERDRKFSQWYKDNGLDDDLDIPLNRNHKLRSLQSEYYPIENDRISYQHFINRACFWMATGSGKTLVLVKLIEILQGLIRHKEIPPNDILILSCRDDLIEQLRGHVREFNEGSSGLFIRLRELREYADAKRDNPILFKDRELTVFYYRSDNMSDEQKERIIDFRNYDDCGRWYVLLDEAHKGDREDSKRQQIYSILSRNGFLFNFSATFTDARDLTTTASNFNLSEFIQKGYGKHIAILPQELHAFRDDQDYNNEEKQKIVLKSLLMLAYARRFLTSVRKTDKSLYHKPLMMTLVNSVNTKDADLQLFFKELERIGKGHISKRVYKEAKKELWEELRQRPEFMFERSKKVEIEKEFLAKLESEDILQGIYNADSPGEIEILIRPSNKQELAFKLRTSDRPFALIKIGDISGWLKDKLTGYEIAQGFDDESYFERLNAADSDINILMGSRSFYEGWDSNRPNVINFINIGMGTDARKFILQAVGRGVRIEPLPGKRKRLLPLHNGNEIDPSLFEKLKNKVEALETLFILGTNRQALQTVIEHLDEEKRQSEFQQLVLTVNEEAKDHQLLIPVYKSTGRTIVEQSGGARFDLQTNELNLLKEYVAYINDTRVLMALHNTEPSNVGLLQESLNDPKRFYKESEKRYGNIDLMVQQIFGYFNVEPQEFDRLKELEEEINHFKHIKVALEDIGELQEKVNQVTQFPEHEKELLSELPRLTPGAQETVRKMLLNEASCSYEHDGMTIDIKYVVNHYYIPLVLSGETERVNYIRHIIQTPSEIRFIKKLEEYLAKTENKFQDFDWWMFSKLDESLDAVRVPYYDGRANRIRDFKPDFVFWLQKGTNYFIAFIDPKGTAHTDYQHKIDGYKAIFEGSTGKPRTIPHDGHDAKVFAFLYTSDLDSLAEGYKNYWFEDIDKALTTISESSQ